MNSFGCCEVHISTMENAFDEFVDIHFGQIDNDDNLW